MKIQSKLLLIYGGVLFSFLLSIAFYNFMTLPSEKIDKEKEMLIKLELKFMDYRAAISKIPYSLYDKQKEIVQELGNNNRESFHSITELHALINSSTLIAEAISKIGNIYSLVENNMTRLEGEMLNVEEDAQMLFGTTSGFKISDFYSKKEALEFDQISRVYNHITNLNSAILSLDFNIQSSLSIIEEQKDIIEQEIQKIKSKSLSITLIIIAVVFLLVVFIVFLISSSIGKAISKIVTNLIEMKNGDLTVQFDDHYKDDIGLLCKDLNSFQKNLSESMKNIQYISDENITFQKNLITTVHQTDETSSLINKNAVVITSQISLLKENIDESFQAVKKVDDVFSTLNGQVTEQMAMVEESTASVTEMISSIESIAKITESKMKSMDKLVETSVTGSEKLQITTGIINLINEKIDSISQMAGVIKGISSRTNLLAMNAAIEAAHAGESGKGFAVVADEIRKLAEASSKQSNQISSNLKEIVENIENARDSGDVTSKAFFEVDEEIKEVSLSLYEISSSISELKNGSEQILTAMTSLQDVSISVRNSSHDLSDASESLKSEMDSVQTISLDVHNKINDVSTGIHTVSESVNSINLLANNVGKVSENLNSELSHFRTVKK
jgi:methyl-accepting chemotaxis protein